MVLLLATGKGSLLVSSVLLVLVTGNEGSTVSSVVLTTCNVATTVLLVLATGKGTSIVAPLLIGGIVVVHPLQYHRLYICVGPLYGALTLWMSRGAVDYFAVLPQMHEFLYYLSNKLTTVV